MKRIAVLFVLLAACGSPRTAESPQPAPGAQQILTRMIATYAGAATYADTGEARTVFVGRSFSDEKSFSTAFVRPSRFRFEVRAGKRADRAYVVWRDGDRAFSLWHRNPGVDEDELGMLLGQASGASHGIAAMIPSLLMPDEVPALGFAGLADVAVAGSETIDGHPCWIVRGRFEDRQTAVFIDQQSYLVRRVVERGSLETGGQVVEVEQTTSYRPSFDAPTAAQLRGPDIAGMQIRRPRKPPWLGVRFDANTTKVIQIIAGSPADGSGLQLGDEVKTIDGEAMTTAAQIVNTIASKEVGAPVAIAVLRGGTEQAISIVLQARPSDDKVARDSLLDKPAPPFAITPLLGSLPASLADLRGHVVLVDFWATWCGPCTTQFPHLVRWHARYAKQGLRIVALSSEEPDVLRTFAAEQKLTYPIALDSDDAIRRAYLAIGIPTTVIIDRAGIVRYVHIGVARATEVEDVIQRLLK